MAGWNENNCVKYILKKLKQAIPKLPCDEPGAPPLAQHREGALQEPALPQTGNDVTLKAVKAAAVTMLIRFIQR